MKQLSIMEAMHSQQATKTTPSKPQRLDPNKTIFLIDGSSFLYRAYYGVRPLHTSKGKPVQAVYSFCRMIKKLSHKFDPRYMALVWDSPGTTTRHEIYPEYKATRQAPPSDLFNQKDDIKEFADLIGLAQVQKAGVEADDLMYSIAQDLNKEDYTAVLITSDKDMGQCLQEKTVLFDAFKEKITDSEDLEVEMGFNPSKLPFYFALLGDASDNIPGVSGIGKKKASELVSQFDSLENLYDHLDRVAKERTRMLLQQSKDNAFLSRDLFLLQYHATGATPESLVFDQDNWGNARPLFEKLEFKTLIKELDKEEGIKRVPKKPLSQCKGYEFIAVTTENQLEKLCKEIQRAGQCAIDTELTGLRPLQDKLVGISICYTKGKAYYIPFGHDVTEEQLAKELVLKYLKPILTNPNIKKYMHFGKFDQLALISNGLHTHGFIFDTLIAAHLANRDWQRIGLKYLSQFYLHETMFSFADAVTHNGYKHFGQLPLALATEYAAADAHQTLQLVPILQDLLKEQHMEKLYDNIEFPLINVLINMQLEGIYCDVKILQQLDERIVEDLERIEQKIAAVAGYEHGAINLNSSKQLTHLLFETLKLPPQKKTTGKTGYSTDQEVLEELAKIHPVPSMILQYRTLFKLKSTYIDALPKFINPHTGRIHSHFSQTGVATGRLASSEPNLQNIPTHTTGYTDITLRSAFKPQEGHLFLSADYSQIELRVLAYFSQDPALVNAFLRDDDIHALTAAKLFDVPLEKVTSEQRQVGKRINFSILYGLTPYGLSKDLDIPFKDAKNYIEKYFDQYPQVSAWMEGIVEETKQHGYVTTHWGRKRYIPGIYEKNRSLYELARRIAINTKAQGTAAELMKLGMIRLDAALREQNLGAKIVLQIHDELLISVPIVHQEQTERLVKQILEGVADWNVPLKVSTRFGSNWQDVTK